MGFSTGKKLLVTKRNMRSGSGALSTWGTNLCQLETDFFYNAYTSIRPQFDYSSVIVGSFSCSNTDEIIKKQSGHLSL